MLPLAFIRPHFGHLPEKSNPPPPPGICENGQVRLSGGSTEPEGRVEICYSETWGTICDNSWSTNDANVVCGQLGYLRRGKLLNVSFDDTGLLWLMPSGAVAYPGARFGPGTGPIHLNNVMCSGAERTIFECTSDGLGVSGSCTHADDAAVMCQESEQLICRLMSA